MVSWWYEHKYLLVPPAEPEQISLEEVEQALFDLKYQYSRLWSIESRTRLTPTNLIIARANVE